MPIAWVGDWVSAQFGNNTGGSLGGRTSTGGNFVAIGYGGNDGAATFSQSQAGTVQTARGFDVLSGGGFDSTCYIENIPGGTSHTITVTTAAGSFSCLNATEYSGVAIAGSLDQTAVGTGSSTTLLSASVTPLASDELQIGVGSMVGAAGAYTAGTNFTLRGHIDNASIGASGYLEDRVVANSGTYQAGAGKSGDTGNWTAQISTFRAATGSPAFQPFLGRVGDPPWQWQQQYGTDPVVAPIVVVWPPPLQRPPRRIVRLAARPGRQTTPVPLQQPPPAPPRPLRQPPRLLTMLRRGRHVMPAPPPPAVIPPPPFVTVGAQHRLWLTMLRRGRHVTPVPPPQVVVVPTVPYDRSLHRIWLTMSRRGRTVSPVPQAPLVPQRATQRRLTPPPSRRGRAAAPVLRQDPPAVVQARRASRIWRPKTRQVVPVPQQTVVIAPPLPLKVISPRRLAGWLFRRNRPAPPPWPQSVNLTIPTITYPTGFVVTSSYILTFAGTPTDTHLVATESGLIIVLSADPDTIQLDDSNRPFGLQ